MWLGTPPQKLGSSQIIDWPEPTDEMARAKNFICFPDSLHAKFFSLISTFFVTSSGRCNIRECLCNVWKEEIGELYVNLQQKSAETFLIGKNVIKEAWVCGLFGKNFVILQMIEHLSLM